MKKMTIVEIVKAVKAIDYTSANRFAEVSSVEFNSKNCQAGSLFIPLTKGTTDGHQYVQNAVENGAIVTLWDRPQEEAPDNIACIFVDDTLQAFQDLARYYLKSNGNKVVAITGSNGKTTTKDMVAAVLGSQYKTYKTQGNYNNEIGVPKTILDMPEKTEVLVLEMGMDDFGQIEQLSRLATPDIAVITLIGDSHLEFLGSREGIAKAKLEIIAGLSEEGVLIVPSQEPLLQGEIGFKRLTFGQNVQADMQLISVQSTTNQTVFTIKDSTILFELPIIGAYNAYNASIAILVGRLFGLTDDIIASALASFKLTANRTEWLMGYNGSRLLNDAYNASPTSMKAILKDFQEIGNSAKKIVVLGDMRELGENSKALHASLADSIQENLDMVLLYGEHMGALYAVLKDRVPVLYEKENKQVLIDWLKQHVEKDDMVLIKSSFGTNLLEVVTSLIAKHEQ